MLHNFNVSHTDLSACAGMSIALALPLWLAFLSYPFWRESERCWVNNILCALFDVESLYPFTVVFLIKYGR